jgi:pilus assembly protein CpaF
MSDFEIIVRAPDGRQSRNEFAAGSAVWLGRDPSCAIALESTLVSRRHACLESLGPGGVLALTDASVNGTRLDGVMLHRERRVLEGEATVEIGPYRLQVRRPENPSPALAAAPELVPRRRQIQRRLLDHLDLANLNVESFDQGALRPKVIAALELICSELCAELHADARAALIGELTDEALGLGPLESLLADPEVAEIMVVDPSTIYVERHGLLERTHVRFTDDDAVRSVIERIITPLGRRIDESAPLCDARLPDGSRVNAIIPPLANRGACITIRKFAQHALGLSELCARGALSQVMADFLSESVRARRNIVIAGGTGSGKTTLLNALSAAIPERERVLTIEDAAELKLHQAHVVSLEARPANMEGKGAYTIRDLVRNALRMRPDRIIVGECRGGEAIDMLQAMNTGHEGSMTTTHANSPVEAVSRLETLCLMAGLDLPIVAIRHQIARSVHLIVQQSRLADGSRRVTCISEVTRIDEHGELELNEIFVFQRGGVDADGKILGSFRATGYLPSFAGELAAQSSSCWGGGR